MVKHEELSCFNLTHSVVLCQLFGTLAEIPVTWQGIDATTVGSTNSWTEVRPVRHLLICAGVCLAADAGTHQAHWW